MPHAYRTEAADRDLRNIAFQIGVESARPQVADKAIDDLIDCCEQLAVLSRLSRLGSAASELGQGVRLFSHQRWVVIFRYIPEGVLILRIADGHQDYLSWKLG
jgi:plasmid stabilization system protein ParE